jgi:acetoin utilization protein AcuB
LEDFLEGRPMARHAVRRFMTVAPVVVAAGASLSEAHGLMRERRIRHLPVLEGGQLVGLVSLRDVYLLQTLRGVDPAVARVEEAMSPEPFRVAPDAPLHEVAREMAHRRIGSAVVVEHGEVVGLFTTVDALEALAVLSRGRTSSVRRQVGTRA